MYIDKIAPNCTSDGNRVGLTLLIPLAAKGGGMRTNSSIKEVSLNFNIYPHSCRVSSSTSVPTCNPPCYLYNFNLLILNY